MKYQFSGPKITRPQLSQMEPCLVSFRLPADYRRFLLAHNGGIPRHVLFDWTHPEHGKQTSTVYDLLPFDPRPLDDINRKADVFRITLLYRDELPRDSVVIGFADRDDPLLLFVDGERGGQVWIKSWDEVWASRENPTPREDAVYFVAPSFRTFIDALYSDASGG